MPIDTSIALNVRPIRLDNPQDIQMKGLQLRELSRRSQAADQGDAEQRTIREIYRQNTKADGTVDHAAFYQGVAQAGLGDLIPGLQKSAIEVDKAQADVGHTNAQTQDTELASHKKKLDMLNGGLSSLLANPNVTHDDVIAQINNFVNQGLISPEEGATAARNTPGRPEQLRPFLVQKALEAADASKRLEAVLPKYDEQDTGGAINQGTIDQVTGVRTPGTNVQKTATPDAAATNARIAAAQTGAGFSDDEGSLMAALAERGISLPAGLRSRAQMKATFASLLSRNPGMTPDDIAEKIATGQINIGAERKETTTAAGQAGKVAVAVEELGTFGDQVLAASGAIPRGQFIPINKLIQMSDAQLSDPALINLKVKMRSLNNAYDQLAARGGTDAEKRAHIAQLFNSAASQEGVAALVSAIKDEAKAAQEAARKATQRRPHETSQAPGPGTGASDVPDDIAALLAKHGGK